MRLFIFILCLLTVLSCVKNKEGNQELYCHFNAEKIGLEFLGKNVNKIKRQNYCYVIKDTLIDSDEGITWNALAFYYKNSLIFLAETNWQEKETITRITILNDKIVTNSGVKIGSTFFEIKNRVSDKIPSMPDGYLSLKDEKTENILYEMKIEVESKLGYGVSKLHEIPDSIKVDYIILHR